MAGSIRPLFKWKYSSVLIPIFFGIAVTMMTWNSFPLAYIFFILSGLWAISHWILSDSVSSGRGSLARLKEIAEKAVDVLDHDPKSKAAITKISKYRNARIHLYARIFGGVLAVVMLTALFLGWTYHVEEEHELSLLEGRLYPANEPTPRNQCDAHSKESSLIVLLGGTNAMMADKFPATLIKVYEQDRLILNRGSDGSLGISLDVLSSDDRVIARIQDGQFIINSNNYLRMKRKDRSTLEIIDQYGKQVLYMKYFNSRAMRLDAVLHYPGTKQDIRISESGITPPNNFYDNCFSILG